MTRAINLISFAAELERLGIEPDLVVAIERAASAGSAHQDLCAARDAIVKLQTMLSVDSRTKSIDDDRGVVGGALLAHAVILYSRSTDTKPIDRRKWFGTSKFTKQEIDWHKEVISYRDTVLAHFGRGEGHPLGTAIHHVLSLNFSNDGKHATEINYFENRTITNYLLVHKIDHLISLCVKNCKISYDKRINELYEIFKSRIPENKEISELASRFFFDYDSVFSPVADIEFDESGSKKLHYARKVLLPKFPK